MRAACRKYVRSVCECVCTPSVSAVPSDERLQYLRSLCLACSSFTTLRKGPHRLDSVSNLENSIRHKMAKHLKTCKVHRFTPHAPTWSQHFSLWVFRGPPTGCCPLAHPQNKEQLPRWMWQLPPLGSRWSQLVIPLRDLWAPAPECLQKKTPPLQYRHRHYMRWPQGGDITRPHTILKQTLLIFNVQVGRQLKSW